jgi:hypothetical protein
VAQRPAAVGETAPAGAWRWPRHRIARGRDPPRTRAWSSPSPAAAPTSAQTPGSGRFPCSFGDRLGTRRYPCGRTTRRWPLVVCGRLNASELRRRLLPRSGVKGSPVQIRPSRRFFERFGDQLGTKWERSWLTVSGRAAERRASGTGSSARNTGGVMGISRYRLPGGVEVERSSAPP